MKYVKGSVDYEINFESYREMLNLIPTTRIERLHLLHWVQLGHDVDTNPWGFLNADGSPMNFLHGYRIRRGYSHGPWDDWEYDIPWKWDSLQHELIRNDSLTR